MQRLLLGIYVLFFGFLASAQTNLQSDFAQKVFLKADGLEEPNKLLGNFEGYTIDSLRYTNQSIAGKTVFINFWFKDCAPCRAELEPLNTLYNKYKDNKDFQFISFTFDSAATVRQMMAMYLFDFPVISMKLKLVRELNLGLDFPTNMVVDGAGKIRWIKCGGPMDIDRAKKKYKLYLKRK